MTMVRAKAGFDSQTERMIVADKILLLFQGFIDQAVYMYIYVNFQVINYCKGHSIYFAIGACAFFMIKQLIIHPRIPSPSEYAVLLAYGEPISLYLAIFSR
jgi:hypothetical protein